MKEASQLKALVVANRRAGRLQALAPQAKPEPLVQSGMRLKAQEHAQAQLLAEAEDRPVSRFLRLVYLKGLQVYLQEQQQSAAH